MAIQVPDISDAAIVFGDVKHLPAWNDIPEDFQRDRHPCCDLASKWFASGLDPAAEGLVPKPGVDGKKALRAVGAVLRSFEPKHEHKIAGAGYLLSQWFDINKPAA